MNLYQKFKSQEILQLIPRGKIVVGVSGGADSVTLLSLMRRLAREKHWIVIAAHIQHHLRGNESLNDQRFVESLCKKWHISCQVSEIHPPKDKGTEEASRDLRYGELAKIAQKTGAKTLVVAHNANDQAETFFLNLLRGTGVQGLGGILPLRPLSDVTGIKSHSTIQVLRPLLSFSRKDILQYLLSEGLEFCRDSSNENLTYRRNWVRKKIIPLIEEMQPQIVERISELTAIFQSENRFFDSMVEKMEKKVLRGRSAPGPEVDLSRLFRYDKSLRLRLLHRLSPHASYKEILNGYAFLLKRWRPFGMDGSKKIKDFFAEGRTDQESEEKE
jgi:tRNA(Ile)-lysidine synthase